MKKFFLTLLAITASMSVSALPLGNPWEASLHTEGILLRARHPDYYDTAVNWCDAWSFRIGYYGDFVFNRNMQVDLYDNHSAMHETRVDTNAGYLALNFWDRVDLFGTLGATKVRITTPSGSFGRGDNVYARIETESYFSWSIGARATVWEWNCLGFGVETQYIFSRPQLNFAAVEADETFYFNNGDRLKYRDWQLGIGVAYRVNIIDDTSAFVPYGGIRWGRSFIKTDDVRVPHPPETVDLNMLVHDLESKRTWGYAIGMTLLGGEKATVTVEGRFMNEKALYVNAQFRL